MFFSIPMTVADFTSAVRGWQRIFDSKDLDFTERMLKNVLSSFSEESVSVWLHNVK